MGRRAGTKPRVTAVTVACLVAMTALGACTSGTSHDNSTATPPSKTLQPQTDGTISRLDCNAIGHSAPTATDLVIDRTIAISGARGGHLQVGDNGVSERWPYFAKTGLGVHASGDWQLIVPPEARSHLQIGWGSPGPPASIVVPAVGCAPTSPKSWSWFPGGFYTDRPACYPLLVETGGRRTPVHVPVGKPCSA